MTKNLEDFFPTFSDTIASLEARIKEMATMNQDGVFTDAIDQSYDRIDELTPEVELVLVGVE